MLNETLNLETISQKKFTSFAEASTNILQLMSNYISINTLFIAKNDKCINEMVKVFNRDYTLLEEGSTLPFEETFCKLAVDNGSKPLIIPDITQSELSKNLNVTKHLETGSFIGIPIYFENGENYGTICGLDTDPIDFTQEHTQMFETMASLLTYILELDNALSAINHLSAPLVPVVKGVAILPIIGDLNFNRIQVIQDIILHKSQSSALHHLVIDLSGTINFDDHVAQYLLRLVKALNLLGVKAILTGIKPELAINVIQTNIDLNEVIIKTNLEQALSYIGITFINKNN